MREVDTSMNTMWFFANPCDGVVTRFENVCQLNKRRGKKLDIYLLLRHPLTYMRNYLLTYLYAYLFTCLFGSSVELSYQKERWRQFQGKRELWWKVLNIYKHLANSSYHTKAVLNRFSDAFYRLMMCFHSWDIFYVSFD